MRCAVQEGEIVCHISPNYLTIETLVHRAFQGISKSQNGFGDPKLGSNAKQCVIKFLECVEQLGSITEFRARRVGVGWANEVGGAWRRSRAGRWRVDSLGHADGPPSRTQRALVGVTR